MWILDMCFVFIKRDELCITNFVAGCPATRGKSYPPGLARSIPQSGYPMILTPWQHWITLSHSTAFL